MQRIGMVIGIQPERVDEYRKMHAAVWPEILGVLREHHVSNYSIFLKDGLLFAYLEYTGKDFARDLKKMGDEPVMQAWYTLCGPWQKPLETRRPGEWWAGMDQVFFME